MPVGPAQLHLIAASRLFSHESHCCLSQPRAHGVFFANWDAQSPKGGVVAQVRCTCCSNWWVCRFLSGRHRDIGSGHTTYVTTCRLCITPQLDGRLSRRHEMLEETQTGEAGFQISVGPGLRLARFEVRHPQGKWLMLPAVCCWPHIPRVANLLPAGKWSRMPCQQCEPIRIRGDSGRKTLDSLR